MCVSLTRGIEPEAKQLSSPRQESMIVDFLMKHPNLATCTIVTDVRQRDVERRLWDDLAIALNNLDGAHHSSVQWRRVCDHIHFFYSSNRDYLYL